MKRFMLSLILLTASMLMHQYRCCLEKERIGLLELKAFFVSVAHSKEFEDKGLVSWVNDEMSDCCVWERVKCNVTAGHLIELSLNSVTGFGLFSTLNLSLFSPFQELQGLDLSGNGFLGFEDVNESFGSLKQIEILNLGRNILNDSSLPYLTSLTSLKNLNISGNSIVGKLEPNQGFANLTNLEVLDLSENHIDGSLAWLGLANFRNLKTLILHQNAITGSLASQGLCELKNLATLDLGSNHMNGHLSQCLGNLSYLKFLDLSYNELTGNIPSTIADPTSLEYLSLFGNSFEGLFSFSLLANLSKLEVIHLSTQNNMFQVVTTEDKPPTYQLRDLLLHNCNLQYGTISSLLLNQKNLRLINLSHNKLVGKFPTWLLQNNTKLEEMHVKNNSLTGVLLLPNFKLILIQLDISNNNFSGELPENIGTVLSNLRYINMSKNNFEGNIPSSTGEMNRLILLDFSRNNFSGELPKIFLIGCLSLTFLKLSYNNFHGQIFPQYMSLSQLMWLILDNNQFSETLGVGLLNANSLKFLGISNNKISGQIPHWIGNISSSLSIILMSKNLFEGSVPAQLSNLEALSTLDISENLLSGPIPSSLSLPYINILYMQKNALNGSIPSSLFSSDLGILNLRDNEFSGSIPQLNGEESYLRVLLLGGNQLQGHIPNQICQARISMLDLSHNKLSGSIPSCFTNMPLWMGEDSEDLTEFVFAKYLYTAWYESPDGKLSYKIDMSVLGPGFDQEVEIGILTKNRYDSYVGIILNNMTGLDLSGNSLTGDIPSEIGDLQGIRALNLSHNSLSGYIPKSFSHLKLIESLDLSYNKLYGRIPPELIELNFLGTFNVSYNNLSGETPTQGQFANFDENNYGGNPNLCGPLLKRKCNSAQAPPSPANEEEKISTIDMVAFRWSFVGSYVTIILALSVILWMNPYWCRIWFNVVDACIDSCFFWFLKYVF